MYSTLQKSIDYAQKLEREFLLVELIQHTEFDSVMSIDTSTENDPMRQQSSNYNLLQMLPKRSL